MYFCQPCKDKTTNPRTGLPTFPPVMGDGLCDVHGRYSFSYRVFNAAVPQCPRCAEELKVCQLCGKEVIQEEGENERDTTDHT